ncbi:MAG: AI-2E family transporter [Candidatus Peregrinibacteria bacterium]
MTKKSPLTAFTQLRIVGRKAQKLFELARQGSGGKNTAKTPVIPPSRHLEEIVVHLSIGSIVRAAFAVLGIALGVVAVYMLRDKIILLFLGIFVAVVIDPGVRALQRFGAPRGIAILVHYVIALFLITFLLSSFIPIIAKQLQQIALFISTEADGFLANPESSIPFLSAELNQRLTVLIQTTLQNLSIHEFSDALQQMGQTLSTTAQGSVLFAAQLAGSVVNFFVNFIIVLVFAFFIQAEKERLVRWLLSIMPLRIRPYFSSKTEAIHLKIGQWARGELMLMFSIFALTFLALAILQMPYALTLAVLAGFCEVIPVMGPLIAAIPAFIIALSQQGFIWALVIAGVYYVIQWCENNLLVPLIMRRAVGLSSIAILFAMLVGISFPDTIHPVIGVMLAIPTTTILALFLEDWTKRHP